MNRKSFMTIGVVALVIGAAFAGASAIPGTALSGMNPIPLFLIGFVGVLVLGVVLDRAARNAASGPRR